MGLAVLPARLKEELELLEEYILSGKDISSNEKIAKHEDWVKELLEKYPDINAENIHKMRISSAFHYLFLPPKGNLLKTKTVVWSSTEKN